MGLDQLAVGQKITITAGRFSYDITKISHDKCSQTNTQTQNTRDCRRQKVWIVPPSSTNNNNNKNALQQNGNGRFVFLWQFLENDNKWKDLGLSIASKLEQLPLNGTIKYSFGKWQYTVNKVAIDECTQTNDSTQNQRDLRRIYFDTKK